MRSRKGLYWESRKQGFMSKRKTVYMQYLESSHWRKLRHEAFERDGYKCSKCGSSKTLQGHHLKYRKPLESCTVEDIESMCIKCHKAHHNRIKMERRRNRVKLDHRKLVKIIGRYSAEDALDLNRVLSLI